jgi:hypothetical protein
MKSKPWGRPKLIGEELDSEVCEQIKFQKEENH